MKVDETQNKRVVMNRGNLCMCVCIHGQHLLSPVSLILPIYLFLLLHIVCRVALTAPPPPLSSP